MRTLGEFGGRTLEEGVEALAPLFEQLPEAMRTAALEMVRSFDPGSVAATTRLLASCEQPFASPQNLGAIDVPALVLPGIDPEHPAEIAQLYVQHLKKPIVVDQSAPDMVQRIADFCGTLDWSRQG
jgi:hypothetical protein